MAAPARWATRLGPAARIIVTLLNAMALNGASCGIASPCIGGGEATAVALERDL